jgi:hypothetical protein
MERKIMKLNIEFGDETRLDRPMQETVPITVKWVPNFRAALRKAARAERRRPSTRRAD